MKTRIHFLFQFITVPTLMSASEIQHVLGGIFDFYLVLTFIVLGINILLLLLYRKKRNKLTALPVLLVGALNTYIGYRLFLSGFEPLFLVGGPSFIVGAYSIVLPVKDSVSNKDNTEEVQNEEGQGSSSKN